MTEFPHSALIPMEATPRITPERAEEVIRLMKANARFPVEPAIVIAVWTGSLVKYLVNDCEAEDTICNLRRASQAAKGSSRLWRTLIRVAEVSGNDVYVVIPAWNSTEKVFVHKPGLPPNIQLQLKAGKRLHAKVNIGAESAADLSFTEWESQ